MSEQAAKILLQNLQASNQWNEEVSVINSIQTLTAAKTVPAANQLFLDAANALPYTGSVFAVSYPVNSNTNDCWFDNHTLAVNYLVPLVDHYMPEMLETHDYYAFGFDMPGRHGGVADYEFSFNGKLDDKWNGNTSAYSDFGNRISDNRLGRWMSEDAHRYKYPSLSPYQMMANNPIIFKDKNGDDIIVYGIDINTNKPTPILIIKTDLIVAEKYTDVPAQIVNTPYDVIVHQPGKPVKFDLDKYLELILNVKDQNTIAKLLLESDAFIVNLGIDFSAGGGAGGNLAMVIINRGNDPGVYFYRSVDAIVGFSSGVGFTAGPIDFNEGSGKKLDRSSFEGYTQGFSIGLNGASITTATSYADGNYHIGFTNAPVLYSGVLMSAPGMSVGGTGLKAGFAAKYYISEGVIMDKFSIQLNIRDKIFGNKKKETNDLSRDVKTYENKTEYLPKKND
jgi:RHS repeat-associated protein